MDTSSRLDQFGSSVVSEDLNFMRVWDSRPKIGANSDGSEDGEAKRRHTFYDTSTPRTTNQISSSLLFRNFQKRTLFQSCSNLQDPNLQTSKPSTLACFLKQGSKELGILLFSAVPHQQNRPVCTYCCYSTVDTVPVESEPLPP